MKQEKRSSGILMVGLGEILWDLLPAGKALGGAPANFAYHASALGNIGISASRVGRDALGREILALLKSKNLETEYIQLDPQLPTGTVAVDVSDDGQPKFTIHENVAWDQLQFTPEFQELAGSVSVICFGTLARRSQVSRNTIQAFLNAAQEDCLKIFDINIRQHYYDRQLILDSLEVSHILKLNDTELPLLAELLNLHQKSEIGRCRAICEKYAQNMVCLTKGKHGSMLVSRDDSYTHPGYQVEAVDSVGSGDAFTAAMAHHVLEGGTLEQISNAANRLGAYVAAQPGATPEIDEQILKSIR
ncbi:carbohydrate kinase [candidate division KSB1 bacterium]|nr:carbohydrate kinase [candidate division KSB1 bacterium]